MIRNLPIICVNTLSLISSVDQAALQLPAHILVTQRQYSFFRNDDDVLRGWKPGFVQSEKLTQKPFDPVSLYGVSRFLADRHAQSSDPRLIPAHDDGETLRIAPNPLLVDPQIILFFPNALIFAKGLAFHLFPPLSRGLPDLPLAQPRELHRQSLPSLRPPPAQDGSAAPGGHPDEETMGSLLLRVAEIRQCLFHRL